MQQDMPRIIESAQSVRRTSQQNRRSGLDILADFATQRLIMEKAHVGQQKKLHPSLSSFGKKLKDKTTPKKRKPSRYWTDREDALLISAVKQYEQSSWELCALTIPGKDNKQCRNRWIYSTQRQQRL